MYAAPELLTTGRLSQAADSYAFGLLLYQAITGQAPFPGLGTMQIIVQVAQQGLRPKIPDAFPPQLADLAQRCWSSDPQARCAAAAALCAGTAACGRRACGEQPPLLLLLALSHRRPSCLAPCLPRRPTATQIINELIAYSAAYSRAAGAPAHAAGAGDVAA